MKRFKILELQSVYLKLALISFWQKSGKNWPNGGHFKKIQWGFAINVLISEFWTNIIILYTPAEGPAQIFNFVIKIVIIIAHYYYAFPTGIDMVLVWNDGASELRIRKQCKNSAYSQLSKHISHIVWTD